MLLSDISNDAIAPASPNDNIVEIASDLHDVDTRIDDDSVEIKELTTTGEMYYIDQCDLKSLINTIEDIGVSKSLLYYLNNNNQLSEFLELQLPAIESLTLHTAAMTKTDILNAADAKLRSLNDSNYTLQNSLQSLAIDTLKDMEQWSTLMTSLSDKLKSALRNSTNDKTINVSIPRQLLDIEYATTCIHRLKENLKTIYDCTMFNMMNKKPTLYKENTAIDYKDIVTTTMNKTTVNKFVALLPSLHMLNYGATKILSNVIKNINATDSFVNMTDVMKSTFSNHVLFINTVADVNKFYTHTGRAIIRLALAYLK